MRNERIDLLRCIGLSMIILAHVDPPALIFQLRNFDVPLMVLMSGVSFSLSYRGEPYRVYLWKRIKRLVFPVWLFLTFYFLCVAATGFPIALPDAGTIAGSYLLLSGIGYVWIIRVFLLIAMIAPVIYQASRKLTNPRRYFSVLAIAYVGYELLLLLTTPLLASTAGILFESVVLYTLPYAIIFAIGVRLPEWSRSQMIRLSVGAWLVFGIVGAILFSVSGKIPLMQDFKYPPSIYYLAYAIGVACFLWLAADVLWNTITRWHLRSPILFLAQNSIWVYLWHIPLVQALNVPFYLKYPCVFGLASLITWIQVTLVTRFLLPRIASPAMKTNVKGLLMG